MRSTRKSRFKFFSKNIVPFKGVERETRECVLKHEEKNSEGKILLRDGFRSFDIAKETKILTKLFQYSIDSKI